jgi:hypothetical protein
MFTTIIIYLYFILLVITAPAMIIFSYVCASKDKGKLYGLLGGMITLILCLCPLTLIFMFAALCQFTGQGICWLIKYFRKDLELISAIIPEPDGDLADWHSRHIASPAKEKPEPDPIDDPIEDRFEILDL